MSIEQNSASQRHVSAVVDASEASLPRIRQRSFAEVPNWTLASLMRRSDLQTGVAHRPGVFQTYLGEFFSGVVQGSQFFFGMGLGSLIMVVLVSIPFLIGADSSGALPLNSLPCLDIRSRAGPRATKPGCSPSI